jgi:uncharacterized protein YcsI (UPF0317 family)
MLLMISERDTAANQFILCRYCIYKNGKLESEVHDATPFWPKNAVAFLIGCSFSYDGALLAADIPLRSVEQNKNVPMYKTNVATKPAGIFHGNVVVSMKPIKATDVAKEVLITSQYPQAHGPPLCVGCPQSIGIGDVSKPDWGDAVEILEDEVPVFHYCNSSTGADGERCGLFHFSFSWAYVCY